VSYGIQEHQMTNEKMSWFTLLILQKSVSRLDQLLTGKSLWLSFSTSVSLNVSWEGNP